jgi:hypothetical protein
MVCVFVRDKLVCSLAQWAAGALRWDARRQIDAICVPARCGVGAPPWAKL